MLAIAWVLSIVAAFMLGCRFEAVQKRLTLIEEALKSKVEKKPEPDPQKSALFDPYSVAEQTRREHEKMMEELNAKNN